jgi:hypothetical protein
MMASAAGVRHVHYAPPPLVGAHDDHAAAIRCRLSRANPALRTWLLIATELRVELLLGENAQLGHLVRFCIKRPSL